MNKERAGQLVGNKRRDEPRSVAAAGPRRLQSKTFLISPKKIRLAAAAAVLRGPRVMAKTKGVSDAAATTWIYNNPLGTNARLVPLVHVPFVSINVPSAPPFPPRGHKTL